MKLLKAGKAFGLLARCEVKLCSAACGSKGESWDSKRQCLTAFACRFSGIVIQQANALTTV